ncbi:hypothetical protein EB052_00825 [bacterium]|nr:hypothetical protein [bacterium]
MKNKAYQIAIAVIVLILVFAGYLSMKGKTSNGLIIGDISSLSGNTAYIGESTMRGVEIGKAKALIEHPGISLNVYHEDSALMPKVGIDAYNKLRDANHMNALIVMGSNVSMAVKPLAAKDGMLFIAASTLANGFSSPDDLSARMTSKADIESVPAVDYLVSKHYSKLGIIYMQNEIGTSLDSSLKKAVEDTKGAVKIVDEEGYAMDNKDFRTLVLKMKQAGVDSIYVAGLAPHTAIILNEADAIGLRNTIFLSYRAAEDPVLIKNAGVLAERLVYTSAYDVNGLSASNTDFVKAYEAKYGELPNGYAAEAYEATRLIVDAYAKCGVALGDAVAMKCTIDFLASVKNRDSVFGPFSFDRNGDVVYSFFMKTVKDGKFVRAD